MEQKVTFGFSNLITKSLAILTTSISALVGNQTKATPRATDAGVDNKSFSYTNFQKRFLKPKLILKLNIDAPESSYASMHTSHSSHASHASHASASPSPGHSSHSSHISSSPSYSPSNTTPVYIPEAPVYKPPKPIKSYSATTISTEGNTSPISYTLGSRTLFKGCSGTDVQELQIILIHLGYVVLSTGDFDTTTEIIVKEFQIANQLTADGKVGPVTLLILKSK